jgi:glycosyltransferase involved in cell wall biosynthesis
MKILQVLPQFTKGGAEKFVIDLSNRLAAEGHEVTIWVIHPVDRSLNEINLRRNVSVRYLWNFEPRKYSKFLVLPFKILRNLSKINSFDVVHCHLTFGYAFGIILLICRKMHVARDVRIIATCHTVGMNINKFQLYLNEWVSWFFDEFVLVAETTRWKEVIRRRRDKNIQVVSNGISLDHMVKQDNQHPSKECWTIGTISRLEDERKPWLFLEVFTEIKRISRKNVRFVLGGFGSRKKELEEMAISKGIESNLYMPGLIVNPREFHSTLDIYLTLNIGSGVGIAALEAIASGLPTVGIQLDEAYLPVGDELIWSDNSPKLVAMEVIHLIERSLRRSEVLTTQELKLRHLYSIERATTEYVKIYRRKK